jgi:hypothetical protein
VLPVGAYKRGRSASKKIVLRSLSSELAAGKQSPPAAPRNQRTSLAYYLHTGFNLHCDRHITVSSPTGSLCPNQ